MAYSDGRPYTFTETEPEALESDSLLLSRVYFDSQEYRRAAYVLDKSFGHALHPGEEPCDASTPNLQAIHSNKTLFLGCYALYMVCDPAGCVLCACVLCACVCRWC